MVIATRRRVARHRDRARILDGAGPTRRQRRRRLPAGGGVSKDDDDVVAMLSLVPWGNTGASLDLMRRSPQSPNGTIELMVSELNMQAEHFGVTRISLNFAMFRSAFEEGARLGAGPIARLWRGLLVFFSRWWQLETLYRSNMKYQPQWVPRYACYEDARLIPRVGVASVIAEGFLVLPFSRRNKQHTGHHPAVPQSVMATGLLHHDGTAPDLAELTDELPPETCRAARAGSGPGTDGQAEASCSPAGWTPIPSGKPPSHTIAQAIDEHRRHRRHRGRPGTADARLRRCAVRRSARLVRPMSNCCLTIRDLDRARRPTSPRRFDLGDLVEVTGTMGFSKNGTRSLIVRSWRLIGKCLRPLPDKWKGLTDPEARVRARYVDLAINSRGARTDRRAQQGVALHPRNVDGQRLSRGRDADTATDPRRRQRPPVPHPHQCLRPRPVSAHRAGAVSEAALRRRRRAGVRAGSRVPQRGRGFQPQPGVHACWRPTRPTPTT